MDAVPTDVQPTAPRLSFWGQPICKTVALVLLVFGGLFVFASWAIVYNELNPTDCVCPNSKGDIKALETAVIRFKNMNSVMPDTLADFVRRPEKHTGPWRKIIEESALIDPWGQPYQYRNPGHHNPNGYDIFSKGPDMKEDTEDDIGNWQD